MVSHFGGELFPGPGSLAEAISFKFLKPVFFDDIIKAIMEITNVNLELGRLTFKMDGFNDQGEKVVEAKATCIPYKIEVENEERWPS